MRAIDKEITMDPAAEARRYVENAKQLLLEHGKLDVENRYYGDRKYVRMAGNTLWNGVLLILNSTFHINKSKGRLNIDDYRTIVGKRDRKLLNYVNAAYDLMHLSMGYDGILEKSVCQKGIQLAEEIIDRCEQLLA